MFVLQGYYELKYWRNIIFVYILTYVVYCSLFFSNSSFIVTFELEFYDMKPEKMKTDIPLLIDSYADHKKGVEHDFKYLGPYLISIKEIPPEPQLVHSKYPVNQM